MPRERRAGTRVAVRLALRARNGVPLHFTDSIGLNGEHPRLEGFVG
jgi:hypothetical protein